LEVPEGGFGEDEDCVNVEDEEYRANLERIEKEERVKKEIRRAAGLPDHDYEDDYEDDDDDDDELIFVTNIDNMDCVAYFLEAINSLNAKEPQLLGAITSSSLSDDKKYSNYLLAD